ncbi:hypothetical protein, partial [Maritalea mobilis]|uniref:hypothetical protein n=1 Tax=Maritalea mobilis TaxID=483324 RepID=UPI001414F02C
RSLDDQLKADPQGPRRPRFPFFSHSQCQRTDTCFCETLCHPADQLLSQPQSILLPANRQIRLPFMEALSNCKSVRAALGGYKTNELACQPIISVKTQKVFSEITLNVIRVLQIQFRMALIVWSDLAVNTLFENFQFTFK